MSLGSNASFGAGGRVVTIRSMSCRGVKAFVPFQKPPLYAAVSLGGRREKTPTDAAGGENPDWEGAAIAFDLDGQQQEQLVQFEVKAQVPLLGNKLVGTASVPVADLAGPVGGGGGSAALRHVSYQVRAPDGKPNGTLSFAYAVTSGGGGGAARPQLSNSVPDGGALQNPALSCAPAPPPPPHPITAFPAPATANYPPPPVSGSSLYPPLHDLLPSSTRPLHPSPPSSLPHAATMPNRPHFPEPNSSTYPPPPDSASAYPPPAPNSSVYPAPPPDSCCPAPPAHYISSCYPPQPPASNYPPPQQSGYPPAAASNLASTTTGTYPPPPPPAESGGSVYPSLPRSADRELQWYPAHPGVYDYPPPPELDGGAARTASNYYPPPGHRYP